MSCTVFVSEISYDVDEDEMYNYFSELGEIVELDPFIHPRKGFTGQARIVYKTQESADAAVASDGELWYGRPLSINHYRGNGEKPVAQAAPEVKDTKTVFIGNLPDCASQDELHAFFGDCGEITSIRLPESLKGRGFVTFKEEESVEKALAKFGQEFYGEGIKLDRCYSETKVRKTIKKGGSITLFVGNLPTGTTGDGVKEVFAGLGEVVSSRVMINKSNHTCGFITFSSEDSVDKAMEQEWTCGGRKLKVGRADEKKKKRKVTDTMDSVEGSRTVWVGNVGRIGVSDVKRALKRFGPVDVVKIPHVDEGAEPKGYIFVAFEQPSSVDKLLEEKPDLRFGSERNVIIRRAKDFRRKKLRFN